MTGVHVSTSINGDPVEYVCPADESLLDVLRDRVGLTGVKEGCGTGDCGACSITLDGTLVCACLVLGAEAEGRKITTIEGMADGEKLHPLQRQFIDNAALQCGVCTPGFLVAGKALLDDNLTRRSRKSAMRWRVISADVRVMTKLLGLFRPRRKIFVGRRNRSSTYEARSKIHRTGI